MEGGERRGKVVDWFLIRGIQFKRNEVGGKIVKWIVQVYCKVSQRGGKVVNRASGIDLEMSERGRNIV
jgi:hypothetical protein